MLVGLAIVDGCDRIGDEAAGGAVDFGEDDGISRSVALRILWADVAHPEEVTGTVWDEL